MAADFLIAILKINIATSAAILLILLVRKPVRRLAGARLASWLWLTPLIAAIAVLLPAIPQHAAPVAPPLRPLLEGAFDAAASWAAPALLVTPTTTTSAIDLTLILAALWAIGACTFLALMLSRQQRGMAAFGQLTCGPDGLWRASGQAGPAVIGLFRPRLVTPADFESRFTPREQHLVLAHERAHLGASHTRINAGLALASCFNWFNPLIHLGVRCARADQELACDAAVVERFPGERRVYAEALLKTQLTSASLPLGCTWPPRSSSLLKERVMMLARKSPGRNTRIAGAGLVVSIGLAAGLAGWAQTPGNTPTTKTPTELIAPLNPHTLDDDHAWKLLQRLREPDGGPPGVAPADLSMLKAQLEARFRNGRETPVAPQLASLDRDALIKAVQSQPTPARIVNVSFTCDVWEGKYTNAGFDWNAFNSEAAVTLTIDANGHPTVALPANAFPSGAFPAHGKITADNRYIDTTSISYRLMSTALIDSLAFIDLDKPIAKVKWERITLAKGGPRETFLTGYCRR